MSQNCTDLLLLPIVPCHFFEFPETRLDFSVSNPEICAKCSVLGKFLTGGAVTDDGSVGPGRPVSIVLWLLTMLFGITGSLTNCLIVAVVMKRKRKKSFDLFLAALACMDLLGSVTAMMASSSIIAFFENWDRGFTANLFAYIGIMTCLLARSGSSFMTVMITLERYLIIAFPYHSRTWFTTKNSKFMIAVIYFFTSIILATPRYTSVKIVPNEFGRDIPSLQSWHYIMVSTPLAQFWYQTMGAYFSRIDFWVPLPTLLLLNFLIYMEIRKFAERRREMNVRQEKEIRAVKMFVPVVVVLFVCNIEPFVYHYFIVKDQIAYRDMGVGIFLSVAVNSSVNMPIYYWKWSSFRKEVKEILSSCALLLCFKEWKNCGCEEKNTEAVDVSSKQSEDYSLTHKL